MVGQAARGRLGSGVSRMVRRVAVLVAGALAIAPAAVASGPSGGGFLARAQVTTVATTVPANGDVNPYGVALLPPNRADADETDVLVSNFNDKANLQGTGTTIVDVNTDGVTKLFAQIDPAKLPGPCPGGVGLTTALVVLPGGWVVVGSLPTTDGTAATAKAGCLIVLDPHGHPVETWSGGPINGPWDATAVPGGHGATLFVTNVLNGTVAAKGTVVQQGTVVRIGIDLRGRMPRRESTTVVATGLAERSDPAALVVGPTGVGLAANGTLFVADTAANRIAAVPNALTRRHPAKPLTVAAGGSLNGPLGLAIAPDGHLLTTNAGDGNVVETTADGHPVATQALDISGSPPGAGALFGLALTPDGRSMFFVDDATNTLGRLG
jgi:hypothetical protein